MCVHKSSTKHDLDLLFFGFSRVGLEGFSRFGFEDFSRVGLEGFSRVGFEDFSRFDFEGLSRTGGLGGKGGIGGSEKSFRRRSFVRDLDLEPAPLREDFALV